MSPVTRGFRGRRNPEPGARIPPGQYLTRDFPVLATGPTPHTRLEKWSFAITRGKTTVASWTWAEFTKLPAEDVTVDIHCVTRWSKLDTRWRGVPVQALLGDTDTGYVMAHSDGGYTTNIPVKELINGKAWVAYAYDGGPLPAEHGGPARLLIPHLYFWKSAKWVRSLELMDTDEPGFWEVNGYNMYGDPWREQRYTGD
ncbi:MAG: sulfite oxidase-like oxidoreductase [Streptosporangiaceae bacterium]|jgi:DMSO/TMAO reductase YedYZ molybdopterin-dependent catalytic subunit